MSHLADEVLIPIKSVIEITRTTSKLSMLSVFLLIFSLLIKRCVSGIIPCITFLDFWRHKNNLKLERIIAKFPYFGTTDYLKYCL